MNDEKTYEDQYGYRIKGCDAFIFNEKCKNCQVEMDQLRDDGQNTYGSQCLYWCPKCGTILDWYDSHNIKEEDWKDPNSALTSV